jgi:hypothetical protein
MLFASLVFRRSCQLRCSPSARRGAARRRRWARADLAAQVDHLFTTTDPGDAHTIAALANGLGEGCRVTK